jgi:hypothetical protein
MHSTATSSMARRALALLVAAAAFLAIASAGASAATTVPGSYYGVTFAGTGSEDVAWDDGGSGSAEQQGTWTVTDAEADLWLPASANAGEEGALQSFPTFSPLSFGSTESDNDTPASLSETGTGLDQGSQLVSYTCTIGSVLDEGTATVTSGVNLGALTVATAYSNNSDRYFISHPWSCDKDLKQPAAFSYGDGGDVDPSGVGTIGYATSVPFADVGQGSFTLPADDQSTINQATMWTNGLRNYTSHQFGISGTYTFTKLCDGTVTYPGDGTATGTCAGAGGGGGGGTPPGGPGTGPGPIAKKFPAKSLHLVAAKPKHGMKGLRRGIKLRFKCPSACSAAATLRISKSTARKAHLGKTLTVGSARAKLSKAGAKTLVVRLNRKALSHLGRLRHLKLGVALKVKLSSGATATATKWLRL